MSLELSANTELTDRIPTKFIREGANIFIADSPTCGHSEIQLISQVKN